MALSTLVVDLILKAGGFESDMGRASKTAQKRMKEIEASAKRAGAVIGTALAAGAVAAAYALKAAVDRADELYNASQKIGVGVEALSALEYAAKQAGVEFDSLQGAIGKMARNQVEAATGNKEAAASWAAFGVEIKDANGNLRDTESTFRDWAQVFSEMEDGPLKTAKAIEIFGKSGADLIPLLNEGAAGIERMTDRARELGVVIDSQTAAAADQFNDTLDDARAAVTGVATAVAADLLPDLQNLVGSFVDNSVKGDNLAETARDIADVFRLTADTAGTLYNMLQAVGNGMVFAAAKAREAAGMGNLLRLLPGFGKDATASADQAWKDMVRNAREAENFASGQWRSGRARAAAPVADQFDRNGREVILGGEGFGKGEPGGGGAKKGLSEAEQAAKQLQSAYERLHEQQLESIALFGQEGEAARVRYATEFGELKNLDQAKKDELVRNAERLDLMEKEKKAADELAETRKRQAEDIAKALSDLQFTLEVAQMLSDVERERAIFLHEHAGATEEQADAYARMQNELRETAENIEVADQFRGHWEDAFAGILDGTKSVKEAFNDLASSILSDIARMIAKQWVEKLFGGFGTTGGGGILGGLFGSAKGNVFDHGVALTAFANGGVVDRPTLFPMARGMGLMGEAGPEAVMPLTRDAQGRLGVRGGGSGFHQTNNFLLQGRPERKTQDQIAQRAGREAQRALARNS